MKKLIIKIMKQTVIAYSAFTFAAISSIFGASEPPNLMTYQGFLLDSGSDPVGKDNPVNRVIQFYVYDQEEDGNILWGEEQTVTVDNGYFSIILGEGNQIPGIDHTTPFGGINRNNATADTRYIGMTVDNVEIKPRLRLMTAPYSHLSQESVKAKIADNAITADRADFAVRSDREIPPNGIILWNSSAAPPAGWAICNGANGTPDLRGKFVAGVKPGDNNFSFQKTGGSNSRKLEVANLPSHKHTVTTKSSGNHNHSASSANAGNHRHVQGSAPLNSNYYFRHGRSNDRPRSTSWEADNRAENNEYYPYTSYAGTHSHSITINKNGSHTHSVTVSNTGSGTAFDNKPAYIALNYIMRIQ